MYSVLLIGAGRSGALFEKDPLRVKPASHLGAILKLKKELKLVGVCDINEDIKENIKDIIGDIPFFTDYKKAIKKIKPDIIVISSWTSTHKDIFQYAIKNNVKGIVIEKPVAKNMEEAKQMLSIWEENGKIPVVVNHERRWDRKYIIAKRLINKGYIGKIKTVYGKVLLGSIPPEYEKNIIKIEGGGPLLHDGTHLFDILYYYFDRLDIKQINCEKGNLIEKTVTGILTANDNIPVFFEIGGEREYFHFIIEIEGAKGVIKVGNGISELYIAEKSKRYTGFKDLVAENFPMDIEKNIPGFLGPYVEIIDSLSKNRLPNSSLYDGIRTLMLIYKIYELIKKKESL